MGPGVESSGGSAANTIVGLASFGAKVAFVGKVKTAAQMTAIIALLLWEPVIPGVSTPLLGAIALWVAAILTLWSMFHYLRLSAPHMRGDALTERRTTIAKAPRQTPPA